MFDLSARETASERMAVWLPALAGLVAAGCVAWLACPEPAPNSLSWSGVAALATGYVLLSALTGLAVTLGSIELLTQGGPPGGRVFNLRVVAAMVWLPPLALFLSQESIWAGMASVAFGWHITKSKRIPRNAWDGGDAILSSELFRTFRAVDSLPLVPSLGALFAAVCAQGGAAAALLGRPIASAAFLGIGSALAAWSSNKFRAAIETQSGNTLKSARRALLPLSFAILFTLAGLMQYTRAGGAGDEAAGSRRPDPTGFLNGTYKGVILLTEPAPHAVLVAPLPLLKHDLFANTLSHPLSVPFSGVYWMFRWPQSRPPDDSYVIRGNPLTTPVFRSSDSLPLSMEAHQNFGTLIDLSCCGKIQVAISSADAFVTLELILTNTTLPGRPSLSLGKASWEGAMPALTFDRRPDGSAAPVQTLLSFDVPRRPEIRKFDEATILFHRAFRTASAKVAIDRFIFVPRGF